MKNYDHEIWRQEYLVQPAYKSNFSDLLAHALHTEVHSYVRRKGLLPRTPTLHECREMVNNAITKFVNAGPNK